MPLDRLELLVTRRCTSRCQHCCFDVRPDGPDMAADEAVRWIAEAAATGLLGSVLLFGGEPMLNPDAVLAGIKTATQLGVPRVDVITNAFWAATEEAARAWVERLHGVGLHRVAISVDAFHAEFTPVERVHCAGEAARAAGMHVTWNVAMLNPDEPVHSDDVRTQEIVRSLRDISDEVHVNGVLAAGRALESFPDQYPRRPGIPSGPCPGPSYGSDLAAPTVFTVDPVGDVSICWGLTIGNAQRRSLTEVIAQYEPTRDSVTATLLSEGPAGLLSLPAAAGFHPRESYANVCDLCRDIVPHLREQEKTA